MGKSIIAIDASDSNTSGILVWVKELLKHAGKFINSDDIIVIFCSTQTKKNLPQYSYVKYISHDFLNGGVVKKNIWKRFILDSCLSEHNCTVLLSPNGDYHGRFEKYVVMNHNMALLDSGEMRRFFPRLNYFRLKFLSLQQKISFSKAARIIALNEYAKEKILNEYNTGIIPIDVINNGLTWNIHKKKDVGSIVEHVNIIYASTINMFKHQWNVLYAVEQLRADGIDAQIKFAGDKYNPAFRKFMSTLKKIDPESKYCQYVGLLNRNELFAEYERADIGVFASTCEAFPFVLLEKMMFGLPVACSNYGVMPTIAKDGVVYFDPLSVDDIYKTLKRLILNVSLRKEKSSRAINIASKYTGDKMAEKTINSLKAAERGA